jgi:hypothetical protein
MTNSSSNMHQTSQIQDEMAVRNFKLQKQEVR